MIVDSERFARILLRDNKMLGSFTVSFLEPEEASRVRVALEALDCKVDTDLVGTTLTVHCAAAANAPAL